MTNQPVLTAFGPDFPFAYDQWLDHGSGLGTLSSERMGGRVAIIGAGISGLVAGYELMRLGLRPVFYEAGQLGGRLRSQPFEGADGIIAELGGMRFPSSARGFYHYADLVGLETQPFPNPLSAAAGSTVIDLEGIRYYAETLADLPQIFQEVARAYDAALEEGADLTALKTAIRERDVSAIKAIWNPLVKAWDERTYYDFITSSEAFSNLSFRHREIFGQVGFGTGGWDSDFPNSMLEILRVSVTEQEEDQQLIVGGAEQLAQRLWHNIPEDCAYWPGGTSLSALNYGAPRPAAKRIFRTDMDKLQDHRSLGTDRRFSSRCRHHPELAAHHLDRY